MFSMPGSDDLRTCLPVVALALLAGASTAQTLDHGSPLLGGVLELRVEGAPPGARVTYIHSPSAGSMVTPFGVLELDRQAAARLGQVFADANGDATFGIHLPLDPSLVETEAHYQALVADPSVLAGAVLTPSVSLRWLGPRVYVGTRGRSAGPSGMEVGGLEIIDAIHDAKLGRINYSGPVPAGEGDAEPVFSGNFARGAVMASPSELVIFDPFFMGTITTLSFQGASRSLLRSPDGELAHVLEMSVGAGARISTVDLALGQVISTVALPAPVSSRWCLDPASNSIFVCELSGAGQTMVRVVDLNSGIAGSAYAIGGSASAFFDEVLLADGQLFLATRTHEVDFSFDGRLSRATLPLTNASIEVESFTKQSLGKLTAIAGLNNLLTFFMQPYAPPVGALRKTRLSASAPWASCGLPWVYLHVDGVAADGGVAWVIDAAANEPPTASEPGQLYELDPLSNSWTTYPRSWLFGPSAVASVAGGLAHKVFVSAPGADPPINIAPELLIIDLSAGTEQGIQIGWEPESLRVVGTP